MMMPTGSIAALSGAYLRKLVPRKLSLMFQKNFLNVIFFVFFCYLFCGSEMFILGCLGNRGFGFFWKKF
jgi:hypothetical protein